VKIEFRDDISAPAGFVFRRLTDFARHERQAMRRGAQVQRTDSGVEPGLGAAWEIVFDYRGKARQVRAEITEWTPPERLRIRGVSGGLDSVTVVDIVALSKTQTRVNVVSELSPNTLTARLLVQSLKLARGTVTARLQTRLHDLGEDIAAAWARKGRDPG